MQNPEPTTPPPPTAAPGAPPTLIVDHFSKTYEGAEAVKDLSFTARAGAIVGLVGPNGAGKTTTLRSVAGILPVKSGRILICGHDITTAERAAKRCLAWVPDDPQPFDALTVQEHLEFTAELYGVPHWRARAEELLHTFELVEKRDALGGELSRGMRQKLALCCAFMSRPALVLLDEPLTGLDPLGIARAKDAFRRLAAEGTTVILSSHLLDLVEELCDDILIVDRGRLVFAGTLDEARRSLIAPAGSSLHEIFLAATGTPSGVPATGGNGAPPAAPPPPPGAPAS